MGAIAVDPYQGIASAMPGGVRLCGAFRCWGAYMRLAAIYRLSNPE